MPPSVGILRVAGRLLATFLELSPCFAADTTSPHSGTDELSRGRVLSWARSVSAGVCEAATGADPPSCTSRTSASMSQDPPPPVLHGAAPHSPRLPGAEVLGSRRREARSRPT